MTIHHLDTWQIEHETERDSSPTYVKVLEEPTHRSLYCRQWNDFFRKHSSSLSSASSGFDHPRSWHISRSFYFFSHPTHSHVRVWKTRTLNGFQQWSMGGRLFSLRFFVSRRCPGFADPFLSRGFRVDKLRSPCWIMVHFTIAIFHLFTIRCLRAFYFGLFRWEQQISLPRWMLSSLMFGLFDGYAFKW